MGYKTSFKQVKEERIVECNCDTCGFCCLDFNSNNNLLKI